jgi:ribosomal protein S18 acetylase RimI-like enzyme
MESTAMAKTRVATLEDLPELLVWLKEEREQTDEGFYSNKEVIESCIRRGEGLCAIENSRILGFAVFQMFSEGGEVHIIEAHPAARRRRIGSQLLQASIETLRNRGAHYVSAECTSAEGEALCRGQGFEDYVDPRNQPRPFDNPKLRLYLSDWRPPERQPWA